MSDLPISRIEISGFQSLRKVNLSLGRFTAVVGPSSSGKSALTRALKLLVNNSRGTSYVSQGMITAQVTAWTPQGEVSIQRGDNNAYMTRTSGGVKTYTKLSGTVPEAVSQALGILSPGQLQFAGQFDSPYLVGSTGAETATVLGALTNMDLFLRAAKEANRRRLQANTELKVYQSSLQTSEAQLEALPDTSEVQPLLQRAEILLQTAEELQTRLDALLRYESAIASLLEQASKPDRSELLSSVQSARKEVDDLESLSRQLTILDDYSTGFTHGLSQVRALDTEIGEAVNQLSRAKTEHETIMHSFKVCPLCGQENVQ